MLRLIGAAVAGIVTWVVLVTILNLGVRTGWHDYAAVEKAMTFTLPMMIVRLAMSGAGSLVAGVVAGMIDRRGRAALFGGIVLLVLFVPEHHAIWDRFPIWYHLTFLISLPLLGWLGGWLAHRSPGGGIRSGLSRCRQFR